MLDPDVQKEFYCEILGMRDLGDGRIGYHEQEVAIRFVEAKLPYAPSPEDLYWKIALSVPNIDLACSQLRNLGVECSEPNQFRDVGYLAKFLDPEGFSIELIDHWFKGDRPNGEYDETLLGGGAHLSLVTLRTSDISAIEPDILRTGMTPLSVQPVEPFGFTLYFYGPPGEKSPNPDLTAIENRTWTYRRPYTVLEVQHVHSGISERVPAENEGGFESLAISSGSIPRLGFL